MTLNTLLALFAAMALLAAVPSVSVLTVIARSASGGFVHGAFATLGVVTGDLLYILLALTGLAFLADAMGGLFVVLTYLGGVYLIGLGYVLWRNKTPPTMPEAGGSVRSLKSSFATGLLVTLGDQKAVIFYVGFLPAFVDLSAVTVWGVAAVMAITVLAVGGVKLAYAYAAHKAGRQIGARAGTVLNRLAAALMIAVGVLILVRA